jgi:hypothetical protein
MTDWSIALACVESELAEDARVPESRICGQVQGSKNGHHACGGDVYGGSTSRFRRGALVHLFLSTISNRKRAGARWATHVFCADTSVTRQQSSPLLDRKKTTTKLRGFSPVLAIISRITIAQRAKRRLKTPSSEGIA